mgnify:CR=1 FL=1
MEINELILICETIILIREKSNPNLWDICANQGRFITISEMDFVQIRVKVPPLL